MIACQITLGGFNSLDYCHFCGGVTSRRLGQYFTEGPSLQMSSCAGASLGTLSLLRLVIQCDQCTGVKVQNQIKSNQGVFNTAINLIQIQIALDH